MTRLPPSADVVVIGGGAIGVSAAFHLAEAGAQVVLLERDSLGSGSTCRSAGGVRAQFSERVNIDLGLRSLEAFERFAQRPGGDIDLRQTGYLFLLDSPDSVDAFERSVELQNALGVPSRMIDVDEAHALSPLISVDGLLGAAYSPRDGHCTPEGVVLGYATAARRLGATLLPHCAAIGLDGDADGIHAVQTAAGPITTSSVVCAAGAWSREVGTWAGVELPVTPLRRQILVTERIDGLPSDLPMTIDYASSFYFHGEGDGLLIGMSDPLEQPGFLLDRDDAWLDRLAPAVAHRAPALTDVGVRTGWAGLYEMTPDHDGLLGVDASGLVYATGFSGHGFLMAPAVGEVVRDLCLGRRPDLDVSRLGVGRFATSIVRTERNLV